VCGALAVAAVVVSSGTLLARGLAWRPLVLLGTISCSLYLWHYPIFWTIERRNPAWPGPVRMMFGIGLALAASAASYTLVERRFMRRSGSRWRAGPRPALTVPSDPQLQGFASPTSPRTD